MKKLRVGLLVAAALGMLPAHGWAQVKVKAKAAAEAEAAPAEGDAAATGDAEAGAEGEAGAEAAGEVPGVDAAGGEEGGLEDICKIDPAACPNLDMDKEAARDIREEIYAMQQIYALRVRRFEHKSAVTVYALVDVSGSMTWGDRVSPADKAALFGAALFAKNPKTARVAVFGTRSKDVTPGQKGSILRNMEVFRQNHGVDHGTNLAQAVQAQYKGEDRIVIFTDMQTHDGGAGEQAP